MELDRQNNEFVVDALDRWVLYNPSLRSRYKATAANAFLLYECAEAAEKIHAVVRGTPSSGFESSSSVKNSRRRAEDALERLPQIFELLGQYVTDSVVSEFEELLEDNNPQTE